MDFNVSIFDAIYIMQSLSLCVDENCFDLNHFGLKVLFGTSLSNTQSRFDKIVKMLTLFVKFSKMKQKLKSLYFSYGNGYNLYNDTWQITQNLQKKRILIQASFMDGLINLLSNLLESLITLNLGLPIYRGCTKTKNMETTKLVQQLTKMLLKKNEGRSKLEIIVLDRMKLTNPIRDSLIFIFGYNNNIHINGNRYHLYLA